MDECEFVGKVEDGLEEEVGRTLGGGGGGGSLMEGGGGGEECGGNAEGEEDVEG